MGNFIDLTGQRFGMLTVIKKADDYIQPNGDHIIRWHCKCDCGNDCIVKGSYLRIERTKSCGCLKKAIGNLLAPVNKKENTYDLSGEYGVGYTSKGEKFYFDLEDYEKIKDYCWHIHKDGYVTARDCDSKKNIRMHKLIMGCLNCRTPIDHKHGEHTKNDNRKENLRICTSSQNGMNRRLFPNNTSGATGVSYNKRDKKWVAYITINRQRCNLGSYQTFEEAVEARKNGEEKYFGEFSYNNSQKEII